jgi:hypothetical protein
MLLIVKGNTLVVTTFQPTRSQAKWLALAYCQDDSRIQTRQR